MPKGTEAPGYSLTLPGFVGPMPVPSKGSTRVAGPPVGAPDATPRGEIAAIPRTRFSADRWAAPAETGWERAASAPTPISAAALAITTIIRALSGIRP